MTMESLRAEKNTQTFLKAVTKNHAKTFIWKVMCLKPIVKIKTISTNIQALIIRNVIEVFITTTGS